MSSYRTITHRCVSFWRKKLSRSHICNAQFSMPTLERFISEVMMFKKAAKIGSPTLPYLFIHCDFRLSSTTSLETGRNNTESKWSCHRFPVAQIWHERLEYEQWNDDWHLDLSSWQFSPYPVHAKILSAGIQALPRIQERKGKTEDLFRIPGTHTWNQQSW